MGAACRAARSPSYQVASLTESFQQINGVRGKFSASGQHVSKLSKQTDGGDILVPLTESLYVPAKLATAESVLGMCAQAWALFRAPVHALRSSTSVHARCIGRTATHTRTARAPAADRDLPPRAVDVGTGYYVEKSAAGAKDYCDRKVKLLEANMGKLSQQLGQRKEQLEVVNQVFHQVRASEVQEPLG